MSDMESRLRQLELDRAVLFDEQANQHREQVSLRQEQDAQRLEIQLLDEEIQAVRAASSAQIQRELYRAWAAVSHELQGMLTAAQLARVRAAAFGTHEITSPLAC
jgi:hypothetical protein